MIPASEVRPIIIFYTARAVHTVQMEILTINNAHQALCFLTRNVPLIKEHLQIQLRVLRADNLHSVPVDTTKCLNSDPLLKTSDPT